MPLALAVGFISVAAWTALFRGHTEAIVWAAAPLLLLGLWRIMPSPAARLAGEALSMPSMQGAVVIPALSIREVRPGRFWTPWVVIRAEGRRSSRLWCGRQLPVFLAVLQRAVPPVSWLLPEDQGWVGRRRRAWWVLFFLLPVAADA